MRIAINGFGRIGRNFLRAYLKDSEAQKMFTIHAINIGNANITMIAHLFTYDTLMGTYQGTVSNDNVYLYIDEKKIKLFSSIDATKLPWAEEKIDWVVDCTGAFTQKSKAQQHILSGARYVLISAPMMDEDIAIIPGVNLHAFDKNKHKIVSLGSCTTNALIPILFVLDSAFTIKNAFMNTIHAYTNTQVLLDVETEDPRRSRAAALNIIPTNTGASMMIEKIMPHLKNNVSGISIRVPIAKVSFLDISFTTEKLITTEKIHAAFQDIKTESRIIDMTNQSLVSSDFSGNNHSVIIDMQLTKVQGDIGKIFGWYDNEWAYSVRLKDFLFFVSKYNA